MEQQRKKRKHSRSDKKSDLPTGTAKQAGAGATVPFLKERVVCLRLKTGLKKKKLQFFRMSSGITRIGDRFIRFGKKGMADFLVFGEGNQPVWVECKSTGLKPDTHQLSFAIGQVRREVPYLVYDGYSWFACRKDGSLVPSEGLF